MPQQIQQFLEASRTAMLPGAASDLPEVAGKVADSESRRGILGLGCVEQMIAALQAALQFVDGVDHDSAAVRGKIKRALRAAGESL